MFARKAFLYLLLCFALVASVFASPEILAPLIDPAKLDTLSGEGAANGRLRKIAYWLEMDRRARNDPAATIEAAQKSLGYAGTARALAVKSSLLRNLVILGRLGCTDEVGMDQLRRGRLCR